MERIDALKPGGGKLADYPFVRRLRNRRLIVYLYLQGFQSAYDRIVHETDLYMSRRHLKQLVACGQWGKALKYIRRFLPPAIGGVEARTLYIFLDTFWAVDNAAACSMGAPVSTAMYRHDVSRLTTMCTGNTKLSSTPPQDTPQAAVQMNPVYCRASLDWKLVREKASLIADDLAYHSPKLRRSLLLPNGPRSPHELLPIGPRRPRHQRRERSRQPTTSCQVLYQQEEENSEGRNRVVDLIEECLKAGMLGQGHLLQSSTMEGAFSIPFSQTMSSTTGPATNTETSSVPNAGAPTFTGLPSYLRWNPSVANSGDSVSRPAKIPWIISATNAGAFGTPSSQTTLHTTGPTKNIETSSVTSPGAPTFTGAAVSQPTKIPWIISATNAELPPALAREEKMVRVPLEERIQENIC